MIQHDDRYEGAGDQTRKEEQVAAQKRCATVLPQWEDISTGVEKRQLDPTTAHYSVYVSYSSTLW